MDCADGVASLNAWGCSLTEQSREQFVLTIGVTAIMALPCSASFVQCKLRPISGAHQVGIWTWQAQCQAGAVQTLVALSVHHPERQA